MAANRLLDRESEEREKEVEEEEEEEEEGVDVGSEKGGEKDDTEERKEGKEEKKGKPFSISKIEVRAHCYTCSTCYLRERSLPVAVSMAAASPTARLSLPL